MAFDTDAADDNFKLDECIDEIKLLKEALRVAREAMDNLLDLIRYETNLPRSARNGITDQTGQIDQGEVEATKIIDKGNETIKQIAAILEGK